MKSKHLSLVGLMALIVVCGLQSLAQDATPPAATATPAPTPPTEVTGDTGIGDKTRRRVALGNNLYCAGYIQTLPAYSTLEVVGGEEEQEQRVYSQGDYIYLGSGAQQNVKVGEFYTVTRPKGGVRSVWSKKKYLGVYVQEVGTVRIVNVKPNGAAVGFVERSCEGILFGDLLIARTDRVVPDQREEVPLDRFTDPNGKAVGRVVLARDNQEVVTRDQIVYIDLGAEDGVKVGDYLTTYRPLGKGNVTRFNDEEVARPTDYGFESLRYRGGKFSNQAPRKKGDKADQEIQTTPGAKKRRPAGLRKVVGEMIIINVQEKTATAVITRTAQEILTGDYVEVQ